MISYIHLFIASVPLSFFYTFIVLSIGQSHCMKWNALKEHSNWIAGTRAPLLCLIRFQVTGVG